MIFKTLVIGKRRLEDYKPLPEANNNSPYKGMVWCVVAKGVNNDELDSALNNLCSSSSGNGTCDALSPGKECYEPVSEILHASYAFSSYWAKFWSHGATCYFDGLAEQTTVDPSKFSFSAINGMEDVLYLCAQGINSIYPYVHSKRLISPLDFLFRFFTFDI